MPTNDRTSLLAATTAAAVIAYVVYAHPSLEAAATVGIAAFVALCMVLRL
ncbi:hypothetical protein [Streptomyces sp. NPDC059063]